MYGIASNGSCIFPTFKQAAFDMVFGFISIVHLPQTSAEISRNHSSEPRAETVLGTVC